MAGREDQKGDAAGAAPAEHLFRTIANYTYDWESWLGLDRRLLWVNPAVERMTGYDTRSCLAMADYPMPMVHAEDRALVEGHLDAAVRGESANDVEFRVDRRDGGLLWAAVSYQPLFDDDGVVLGVRTSVRDITQRKHAEQDRERALEEARRANAAKSRFLAAASHDLRQPLQAASWFLAVIEERPGEGEQRQVVESLRQCLTSSQSLLDALLDISRLDAGVMDIHPAAVEIWDLFEELEVEFTSQARGKGLRLQFVPTSARVECDPVLLRRVLQNYVANAIRYTEKGRVLIGVRAVQGGSRIEVHDTGIGIAPERHGDVFDEFVQIGNPERDRRSGLGLGLSIVRRIADLVGAPTGMRSAEGLGSCFWIELPAVRSAQVPPSQPPAQGTLAGRTIAVVDDDPDQVAGLRAFLGMLGCRVVAGESAEEVLVEAGDHPADIIVADYRLRGGATGNQAIAALVAVWRERPAILLTGDTDPDRLAEARAGGFALLHKPVDPSALRRTLLELLERFA